MTQELVNKAKVNYFINELPLDLQSIIFSFVPPTDTAKIIKKVIDAYEKDHKPELTQRYKMYYIKDILSFVDYIYDSNSCMGKGYDFGPQNYNNGKFVYFEHGWMEWIINKQKKLNYFPTPN